MLEILIRSGQLTLREMLEISPDIARAALKEREALGEHIDARLWHEIEAPGHVYKLTLETVDEFLRLIWQEADPARFLTPPETTQM
jgi:hypothetical protein